MIYCQVTAFGSSAGAISLADLYLNSGLEDLVRATVSDALSVMSVAIIHVRMQDYREWVFWHDSCLQRNPARDGVDELRRGNA